VQEIQQVQRSIQAVGAEAHVGQSAFNQTAARFDIRNYAMVGMWEHAYRDGGFEALEPRRRGRAKPMTASDTMKPDQAPDDDKRSREELLAEVNQLRMELAYVKKL
jgi:transposase